jgi:hypothetical protein
MPIIHGATDRMVKPESSLLLKEILDGNRVANNRVVFEGTGHNAHVERSDETYRLLHEWSSQPGRSG